jgi:hypothetical protein
MIEGVRWYTGRVCIGIVQVVPDHQKEHYRQTGDADFKYYIGLGGGRDERQDMQTIAELGVAFETAAGDILFGVNRGELR